MAVLEVALANGNTGPPPVCCENVYVIPPVAVMVKLFPGQEEGEDAVKEGVMVAILAAKVA